MNAQVVQLKRFYVYALKTKDGSAFYVGKGTGTRAMSHLNKSLNTAAGELIAGADDGLLVEILSWHSSSKEAEIEERRVIKTYPDGQLLNIVHTKRKPKTWRQPQDTASLNVYIDERLYSAIVRLARDERRTLKATVEMLVSEALAARAANGNGARG